MANGTSTSLNLLVLPWTQSSKSTEDIYDAIGTVTWIAQVLLKPLMNNSSRGLVVPKWRKNSHEIEFKDRKQTSRSKNASSDKRMALLCLSAAEEWKQKARAHCSTLIVALMNTNASTSTVKILMFHDNGPSERLSFNERRGTRKLEHAILFSGFDAVAITKLDSIIRF